jgi:c-di-GMP-binding flagellar brake protein YcgR
MSEHRVHPRYDIRLAAEVTTSERTFTATTRNLSSGGCCLESHYPLPEGAEIRLDLFVVYEGVEDERMPPLSTRGTIQWAAETDDGSLTAGVKFEGLTDAQQQWLGTFLNKSAHDD